MKFMLKIGIHHLKKWLNQILRLWFFVIQDFEEGNIKGVLAFWKKFLLKDYILCGASVQLGVQMSRTKPEPNQAQLRLV